MTDNLPMRREPTELGITPRTLDEAHTMCETLFNSGLMPDELKSPQQVFVVMQYGAEIGLKPMTALRQIFVVKGKPSPSAQLMHGMAIRHPDCEFFRVSDGDRCAVVKVRRKSWPAGEVDTFTYSMADASTAGLNSPLWRNHPKAMLRNRAIAAAARAVFPDVLANMYEPDETEHMARPPAKSHRVDTRSAADRDQATAPDVVDGEVVAEPGLSARAQLERELVKAEIDPKSFDAFLAAGPNGLPKNDAQVNAVRAWFFGDDHAERLAMFREWAKASWGTPDEATSR